MKTIEITRGRRYVRTDSVLQLEVGEVLVLCNVDRYDFTSPYNFDQTWVVEKVGVKEARIVSTQDPTHSVRIQSTTSIHELRAYNTASFEEVAIPSYSKRNFYLLNDQTRPTLEEFNKKSQERQELRDAERKANQEEVAKWREDRRLKTLTRLPSQLEQVVALLKGLDLASLNFNQITELEGALSRIEGLKPLN